MIYVHSKTFTELAKAGLNVFAEVARVSVDDALEPGRVYTELPPEIAAKRQAQQDREDAYRQKMGVE